MRQILTAIAVAYAMRLPVVFQPVQAIDYERSIEAIRRFRRAALGDGANPVVMNFCGVKDAFDGAGNLKQPRQYAKEFGSKRVECTDKCAPTNLPVVCFEQPRLEGDMIVFPAFRLTPSGARIGEEYTLASEPNPSFHFVKLYKITSVQMN